MLSQSVGYAASALSVVAAAGGRPLRVREIAETASIPAPYLAKIVHALARKELVTTQRGIGGGVTLSRAAAEISLYDLCIALDDPAVIPRCMLGTSECSDCRACPAHAYWSEQRARHIDFLRRLTVADIAAFEARRVAAQAAAAGSAPKGPAAGQITISATSAAALLNAAITGSL
jgi:Rrf2 family protein